MIISPTEKDFIDIHSHRADKEDNVFRILNVFSTDFQTFPPEQAISVGLHPWYLNDDSIESLPGILNLSLKLPQVKAVGETGLDKIVRTDLNRQEEVFITHIKFAFEYKKPLVIHCVRAYSELIKLKDEFGSGISWIIHGFNGNEHSAKDLISKGFYISIGNRLLRNKGKVPGIIKHIPPERIFIESDEDKVPVRDLYSEAAELYKTDILSMKTIIRENYRTVFNE